MNLNVSESDNFEGEYLEQTQDERNEGIMEAWGPIWYINAFQNYEHILKLGAQKDIDLSTLRKKNRNEPAVIIGSGPSLDKTAPLLGEWDYPVFACGSNAIIPTRWGHQPEYIMVFDAGDTVYPKLLGYDWKDSTLITNPCVSPVVLENWKWDKYFYLMQHKGYQWFEDIMPTVFGDFTRFPFQAPPRIRTRVGNAGCTVNNAIQIAHFLGYDPLFLLGVDFGYPDGKERCTRWSFEFGEWSDVGPEVYPDRKLHKSKNGIATTEEQIEYKSALLSVYQIDNIAGVDIEKRDKGEFDEIGRMQLFDCSEGIITELPKADFRKVVENNGRGFEGQYNRVTDIIKIVNDYDNEWQELQNKRDVNRPIGELFDQAK